MGLVFIVIYVTFCLLVAWAGKHTRLGFTGAFFLSMGLTPLFAAILLLLFGPKRKKKA